MNERAYLHFAQATVSQRADPAVLRLSGHYLFDALEAIAWPHLANQYLHNEP